MKKGRAKSKSCSKKVRACQLCVLPLCCTVITSQVNHWKSVLLSFQVFLCISEPILCFLQDPSEVSYALSDCIWLEKQNTACLLRLSKEFSLVCLLEDVVIVIIKQNGCCCLQGNITTVYLHSIGQVKICPPETSSFAAS